MQIIIALEDKTIMYTFSDDSEIHMHTPHQGWTTIKDKANNKTWYFNTAYIIGIGPTL